MPRLRNPSLKVRENMVFAVPTPPGSSTRSTRLSTPSRATPDPAPAPSPAVKTPATTRTTRAGSTSRPTTTGKKPIGRPKKVQKKTTRPRRGKAKYEDELEDFGYEEESGTSSSSDDDEDFVIKNEPIEDYDDDVDEPNIPKAEYSYEDGDEIACPWIEQENLPPLNLPDSSIDIPVPKDVIMDLIEVYELLRSYSRILKLSPFIFEDFCQAMGSPDNSCILAEVHITLMKALLKTDDEDQVHFSANDTNNAVNITFYALDSMCYGEVLRLYLESDRVRGRVPEEILNAINTPNYPFVTLDSRLLVITYLCYRFIDYNQDFKKNITNNGKIANDEICRLCQKGGDLLYCDNCELSYHSFCHRIPIPESNIFICKLCKLNEVKGVTGCEPIDQVCNKMPLRMTPIGRDRHGRVYWFVVRRIIIQDESEGSITYYSTAPQLQELVNLLDPIVYERDICLVIEERLSDILEQMSVTLELTMERMHDVRYEQAAKNRPFTETAYLHVDNVGRMKKILQIAQQRERPEMKEDDEDEDEYDSLAMKLEPLLGIGKDGSLQNTFWAGQLEEEMVLKGANPSKDINSNFALGHPKFDDQYRKYKNHYTIHEHGDSIAIRKKANDKKKYLATRFSIFEAGDDCFRWSTAKGKDMYGPERQHAKYLEWTIAKMQKKIPEAMMHRRWPIALSKWKQDLAKSETYEDLADSLLRLEACMRRTFFLQQFWSSLGLTRWLKAYPEDREQSSREVQKRKKEEKDASSPDFDDPDFIRVKYTLLPTKQCPQTLWRMKDEQYRLGAKYALGGWLWISSTRQRVWTPVPAAPPLDVLNTAENDVSPVVLPVVKKARRIEMVAQRLKTWREKELTIAENSRTNSNCYSPGCMRGLTGRPISDGSTGVQSCYSYACRMSAGPSTSSTFSDLDTKGVVKARDPQRFPVKPQHVGEGTEMWPLLEPTPFRSRGTGKKSILVVPDIILRKLARTAGRVAIYVPNFSLSAKSNFSLWNYPCPRPCFDLCWKWLTTNANSLHAVSLQLKILWYCVKWPELSYGDHETDGGHLVVHQPDRDEIRRIIGHKEFPPQGTYERYLLKIEAVMLDDDGDEDYDRSSSTRKKPANNRPKRATINRFTRRMEREEWIDGIELKVFEIRDYWDRVAVQPNVLQKVVWASLTVTHDEVARLRRRKDVKVQYQTIPSRPSSSGLPQLPAKRTAVPPRRDVNFAYDDTEFDRMEQTSSEPAAKKARVILQPGVSVGYPKPAFSYTPLSKTEGTEQRPVNGSGIRSNLTPGAQANRVTFATTTIPQNGARVIPRAAAGNEQPRYVVAAPQTPSASSQANPMPRQIVYTTAPRPAGVSNPNERLLLIRRNDGTTQYVRAVSHAEGTSSGIKAFPAGAVVRNGSAQAGAPPAGRPVQAVTRTVGNATRIIRVGPNGEKIVMTLPPGTKITSRIDQNGRPVGQMQIHPVPGQAARPNGQYSHPGASPVTRLPVRTHQMAAAPMYPAPSSNGTSGYEDANSNASDMPDFDHDLTSSSAFAPPPPEVKKEELDFDENFLEPPPPSGQLDGQSSTDQIQNSPLS